MSRLFTLPKIHFASQVGKMSSRDSNQGLFCFVFNNVLEHALLLNCMKEMAMTNYLKLIAIAVGFIGHH